MDNEPQCRSLAIEIFVRTEVNRRNRSFRALASSPRFVEERRRRLVVQQFFRSVGVTLLSMSNRNNFCYSVLPSHREYVRRNDEAPRSLDLPCLSALRMLGQEGSGVPNAHREPFSGGRASRGEISDFPLEPTLRALRESRATLDHQADLFETAAFSASEMILSISSKASSKSTLSPRSSSAIPSASSRI